MHLEFQLKRATQPLTNTWQKIPIAPRQSTRLGISFRPLQAAAFGLEERATLRDLLTYPFQIIRLGAYWNQIEPEKDSFLTDRLDWQLDAAEQAGKQILLCIGPLKTFGYPEFFVPLHQLRRPFPEHSRITPSAYAPLLQAATDHIARLVERYSQRKSILAWQLEHEAIDPLGVEHSWRLDASFVEAEMAALRKADSIHPVLMNGFLPTSLPVRLSQWWQTRDQGDSLALAQRLADWVGIDDYPRNALLGIGGKTLYLDGSQSSWLHEKRSQLLRWARAQGKCLLVTEGQSEPWETATTPSGPAGQGMVSCLQEHIITNYNAWFSMAGQADALYAYLFWGAEYWLRRKQGGDAGYFQAFTRILEEGDGV